MTPYTGVGSASFIWSHMKKQKPAIQKIGFSFPVQVLKYAEEEGDFHIVGYAATTDFDLQGDVISEQALRASAQDLLKNSTILLNHDPELPIGKVVKAEFNKNGLLIDALISKTEPEIIQKIKEGILNKFSIRGQVLDRERIFSPEYNRMVNVINRMSLIEVSLVSVPANPEAKAIGWYISKALENTEAEGVKPMPEEVIPGTGTPCGTARCGEAVYAADSQGRVETARARRAPAGGSAQRAHRL